MTTDAHLATTRTASPSPRTGLPTPVSEDDPSLGPRGRWVGTALVAAVAVYLVAEAVVATAWDQRPYSYVDDYITFLGSPFVGDFEGHLISSPLWWVMSTAWIVAGALLAAAGIGLSRALAGWRRRTVASLGVAEGVALVLFAVFPLGPETMHDGTLPLYLLGAFLSIVAGNASAVVAGVSGRVLGLPRWLARSSLVLGAIGLVNIPATYGWAPTGLAERVSLYSFLTWALLMGVHLLVVRNGAARPAPSPLTVTEVVLPGIVEPAGLEIRTRDLPAVGRGEAVVAVEATGISMAEQSMRRGRYPGQPSFPFVPGYDLVGTVTGTGPGVDPTLVGTRVAAMTKTGGWATHAVLSAGDLVVVPRELDPVEVETLVVNGVTAWQMLHRSARVAPGETILVHGANGGVGTTLVQLAVHHGAVVIGTAHPRHHDALRAMGVIPVDYDDPDLSETVRGLAPSGVDAVFDHLGGESLDRSWSLLAKGGRLVAYAIATKVQGTGSIWGPFLAAVGKVVAWNAMPNGRRASFYDLWSGHLRRPARFRSRVREDMGAVLALLADGTLAPQVAATYPLVDVREAMTLAESRTVRGKVVLVP